jgi:translocation and assembly module TamB
MLQGSINVSGLDLSAAPLGRDHLRLNVLQIPCQITWQGKQVDVQQLGIQCDVGQLNLSGQTSLPDNIAARPLGDWLRETFSLGADLDLAKLAKLLPETLHVRQQVRLTSGNIKLAVASGADGGTHRWSGQLQASNITATNAGAPISWDQPISVNFAAHDTLTGPVVDKLDCQSSFVHVAGNGTPDHFTAQADCDLDRLAGELGQFVDLGGVKPKGSGQATLDWQRMSDATFRSSATCQLVNLQLGISGRMWSEPSLAVALNASGQIAQTGGARIDKASLDVTSDSLVGVPPSGGAAQSKGYQAGTSTKTSGSDHLTVQILEPIANISSLAALAQSHVAVTLQGDLARWQSRLSPWISLGAWQLGGACDLSAQIASSAKGVDVQQVHATVNRLHAWGSGLFIDDPSMQIDSAASWDAAGRTLKVAPTNLTASAVVLKATETTLRLPTQGPPSLVGAVAWQADMSRFASWLRDPRTQPASTIAGRFTGQATLSESASTTTVQLNGAIDNLVVAGVPVGVPPLGGGAGRPLGPPAGRPPTGGTPTAWREQKLTIGAGGKYDRAADMLNLDSFDITSSALHFKGAGTIAQLSGRQDAELAGQIDYDWQTLGPLLRPYFGSQLQLAGRQSRPFSLHGPLAAAVTPASTADTLAWLRPLTIEAGSGWTSASIGGIQLGPAQFDAQFADGTLSLVKPLQVSVSDGQMILSPRVRLSPGPAMLMLDKGPLLRQIRLSQEMCSQWLRYVSPLAHEAARAQGQFSVDLTGGRVPLTNPTIGDVAGKLTIISADINPGPIIHPFALLGRQVRAILQGQPPPLAAGSDRPLVHYPPQTVDFRVVNQRVYHDRIEMNIGDLVIRTRGSVGLIDESLVLEAEIPLKAAPPLLGPNSKQPPQEQVVIIPIEGTLGNPKFPPGTIEKLAAQILKNSTRNTIREGIDKIDNLFLPK